MMLFLLNTKTHTHTQFHYNVDLERHAALISYDILVETTFNMWYGGKADTRAALYYGDFLAFKLSSMAIAI